MIRFDFVHADSGERRSVSMTHTELVDELENHLIDKLDAEYCQCTPDAPESNVVECNCESYLEGFALQHDEPGTQPDRQRAAAALYQILGSYNAPAKVLDLASALMNGEPLPFDPVELLPFAPEGEKQGQFFAYDDDTGFERFNTAVEAIAATENSIDEWRALASEGWPEEVENVCWGVVLGKTKQIPIRDHQENMAALLDRFVDYELTDTRLQTTSAAPEEWINKVMEQAQVFASSWALVGGRFDAGRALENAEVQKQALREMLQAAPATAEESSADQPAPEEVYGKTPGCKQCDEAEACGLTFCPECDATLASTPQPKEGGE
ncbi:hypothetical protein DK842_17740 [Chromobacterium phragmitis]|uniref:hypothetical protein n=1 Tax=Chromobacterium phragmitis TaxID=2202141 RepID=UPI000DECDA1E|nr:hypothetical protein [Chromobacterium phragmitis]AXE31580.1 hypothetical protein DK842_17740 [Chromobacterium phragmitis]